MVRVADYLMQTLYETGVKHVFTVTGRGALFLTDALAAHKSLSTICTHHEQAAAFAAVAYSDCSENLGACVVSTGCAGTNTLTGVLNAWQDGIPCVFISGQNKLKETSRYTKLPIRTYGQQEADIIPIVTPITKYAVMLTDHKRTRYEIEKALYLAKHGRKGPVWIDIPLDVQNMRINPNELEGYVPEYEKSRQPTKDDVNYIVNCLSEAKRPVVIIGSGIRSSGAIDDLEYFIEKHQLPLTFTSSATDTFGSSNKLSIGAVGAMGCSRAANFTVQNSDFILVLGSRMSSMTTGETCKFARDAKIVIVDIDEVEHSKCGVKIDRLVLSDVKELLQELNKSSSIQLNTTEWVKKCVHWKSVFPLCEPQHKSDSKVDLYQLAEALTEILPNNAHVVTDSGLIELIIPNNIRYKKGQRSIHPASQGSMGSSLPSAIGAHFTGKGPTIVVVGDGSIMMNLQELETIRYNKIPIKIFVINNNAYSVIRKRQVELFASRTIGTDPSNGVSCPDFEKVAHAFGISFRRIEGVQSLLTDLHSVLHENGPVLCEVMGLENQNYIHSSYTKNRLGRLVHRPIEDQSPFLDRNTFLSEMIVEPIDQ